MIVQTARSDGNIVLEQELGSAGKSVVAYPAMRERLFKSLDARVRNVGMRKMKGRKLPQLGRMSAGDSACQPAGIASLPKEIEKLTVSVAAIDTQPGFCRQRG